MPGWCELRLIEEVGWLAFLEFLAEFRRVRRWMSLLLSNFQPLLSRRNLDHQQIVRNLIGLAADVHFAKVEEVSGVTDGLGFEQAQT